MANLFPDKPTSRVPNKRAGQKAEASKTTTVGYAYSGSFDDLPKTLGDGVSWGRIRKGGAAGSEEVSEARIGDVAYEPDERARAILRGRKYAAEDLKAAGGTYGVDDVRKLLNNISRQAIDKRVNEGALLAVPGPGGTRRFPTAQFDKHGGVVKGLKTVRKALGFSSTWAVLNFLVNGHDHLDGRRPIDVLHQGDVDSVVAAAASIGVQGA